MPQTLQDVLRDIQSVAALEYIGFTPQAAQEIFATWSTRPNPDSNPDDVLHYALDYVLSHKPSEASPVRQTMTRVGISTRMQDIPPDLELADSALTDIQLYWIYETLENNFCRLLILQSHLKEMESRGRPQETGEADPPRYEP